MARKAVLLVWPLLALLVLPGCKHPGSPCTPAVDEEEAGHVVARSRINPAAQVLPASLGDKAEERTYWGMTRQETQCRAAEKSGTADMMEKEYKSLESQNCLTRNSKSTQMKKTMLRHSSVEARNVAAGTALELYYRLAELEAKSDLLRDGLVIVNDSLGELRKVKDQGLKIPSEYASLQKQQLELAADLTRAQLGIQQINGEMGRLLNWHNLGLGGYLWPVDFFTMSEAKDDPEAAVALGMTHRAQLSLIRAVRDDVDAKTLPTMLLLLRSYNGFLGMSRSESFMSFMGAGIALGKRKDVDIRRQQMDDMLKEQEFVVGQEIRQAIHTIRAKTNLVALAKEKINIAQDKLKDLEDKKKRGVASVLEISAQRLILGQAQGELIQEVMAWHTARAKLKQAQGILAMECGFTPEHPWSETGRPCNAAVSSREVTASPEPFHGPLRGTLLPPVPENSEAHFVPAICGGAF
jgi:hypothetical protein